jgi:hypothetical protein
MFPRCDAGTRTAESDMVASFVPGNPAMQIVRQPTEVAYSKASTSEREFPEALMPIITSPGLATFRNSSTRAWSWCGSSGAPAIAGRSSLKTKIRNLAVRLRLDDLTMSQRRRDAAIALLSVPQTKMQWPCARASRKSSNIPSTALRSVLLSAFSNSARYCSGYCIVIANQVMQQLQDQHGHQQAAISHLEVHGGAERKMRLPPEKFKSLQRSLAIPLRTPAFKQARRSADICWYLA